MATMEEIAYEKGKKRGHSLYQHSIGRSGRYKFVCQGCSWSLNYYEGEWFGGALEYNCVDEEKGD